MGPVRGRRCWCWTNPASRSPGTGRAAALDTSSWQPPLQPGKDVVTDVTGNDLFIQVPVLFRYRLGTLWCARHLRASAMVSALLWQAG